MVLLQVWAALRCGTSAPACARRFRRGSAVVAAPGLPFQTVVHAVAPSWESASWRADLLRPTRRPCDPAGRCGDAAARRGAAGHPSPTRPRPPRPAAAAASAAPATRVLRRRRRVERSTRFCNRSRLHAQKEHATVFTPEGEDRPAPRRAGGGSPASSECLAAAPARRSGGGTVARDSRGLVRGRVGAALARRRSGRASSVTRVTHRKLAHARSPPKHPVLADPAALRSTGCLRIPGRRNQSSPEQELALPIVCRWPEAPGIPRTSAPPGVRFFFSLLVFFLSRKSVAAAPPEESGQLLQGTKPRACKKPPAAAKEKTPPTGRSPPPQGQGSGRRSVADNARFGALQLVGAPRAAASIGACAAAARHQAYNLSTRRRAPTGHNPRLQSRKTPTAATASSVASRLDTKSSNTKARS